MNMGFETILKKIRHQVDTAEHKENVVYVQLNVTSPNDFDAARYYIKQIKIAIDDPKRLASEIDFLDTQMNKLSQHVFQFGMHALRREHDGLRSLQKTLAAGTEPEIQQFRTALDLIDEAILTECEKNSPNRYDALSRIEDIIEAFAEPQKVQQNLQKTRTKMRALRADYVKTGRKRDRRKLMTLGDRHKQKTILLRKFSHGNGPGSMI